MPRTYPEAAIADRGGGMTGATVTGRPAAGSAIGMDDERDTTNQPLPGSVSNQNGEEAEPGQDGGSGSGETRRQPPDKDEHPSGGESSEGSQSTGDPRSAG
jgi:hypothetical protein